MARLRVMGPRLAGIPRISQAEHRIAERRPPRPASRSFCSNVTDILRLAGDFPAMPGEFGPGVRAVQQAAQRVQQRGLARKPEGPTMLTISPLPSVRLRSPDHRPRSAPSTLVAFGDAFRRPAGFPAMPGRARHSCLRELGVGAR